MRRRSQGTTSEAVGGGRKAAAVVVGVLGCFAWGCAGPHPDPAGAPLPKATIYQRATNQFAQADFYKPAEPKTNELAFALAPLVLQEVTGATAQANPPDRFGTLSVSNGLWVLDCSHPSVYWHADTVTLGGKAHARLAYWWFYPSWGLELGHSEAATTPHPGPLPEGEGGSSAAKGAIASSPSDGSWGAARSERAPYLQVQGVRLTLNSAGQPAIWEVLADSSGARLVFVSQSLEAAAAARFGKALPGRRHAIERSVEEAPEVVVARVIDDGPIAMGPIVYLSAGTRTVSTLICRCMPAQVKTLRTTATYDLLPLPAIPSDLLPLTPGFWPGEAATDNRLEKWLRLPVF